jgi:two-component system NarL family response regulator
VTGKPLIRVLCVDDHAVVREGITLIIDMQPDMQVVGCAATGEAAIELYRRHRPAVTLMDLQLPGITGLDTIRSIRREDPAARIIVLTMYEGDEDIFRALQAGAATYLLKNTLSDDLVRVVREVDSGEQPLSVEVASRLATRRMESALTQRETDVLTLLAQGLRNKEIGARLGITEETAHGYIKSIFQKLKVQDRTAAVTVGLRRGIIHLK